MCVESCHQRDPRPLDQNDEEVHGAGTIQYGPDWYGMGQSSVADPDLGSTTLTVDTVRYGIVPFFFIRHDFFCHI
jgi:hypothetical protein